MNTSGSAKFYSPAEELVNVVSHGLGLVLSVFALIALLLKASASDNTWHVLIAGIFGVSLILLYATSALYHSTTEPQRRKKLRILDHAMIYVLIAGTSTPLALITLEGKVGWLLFGASWSMALTGIALKIFFTGRYELLSTLMYVFMGWLVVFAIKPLLRSMPLNGLYWLLAGGLFYTVGAILYAIKGIRFNHAIFHLFVLAGSASHFVAVFAFVLPAAQP